jgi:hypothetical protein
MRRVLAIQANVARMTCKPVSYVPRQEYLTRPVCQVHALSPSSGNRPEVADESVLGEGLLRLLRRGRLEIKVESGRVPVKSKIIDRPPTDHGSRLIGVRCQPGIKLPFRPEGQDVGSCEPDVVPEPSGWNEKVDDPIPGDATVEHVEADWRA